LSAAEAVPRILLVEDNPADVRLMREAFAEQGTSVELVIAGDGEEAMRLLQDPVNRPDLILLDLNLPRKDGREVLAEIKADAGLRIIPVLVLTSSEAERDVEHSYALHANVYLRKPLSYTELQAIVAAIDTFWLTVARLPPRGDGSTSLST
jgi:chemotaxis family two-component system response regulator Rcp1